MLVKQMHQNLSECALDLSHLSQQLLTYNFSDIQKKYHVFVDGAHVWQLTTNRS